ncbi:hypothetical protein [Hydrogenivirga sp.]
MTPGGLSLLYAPPFSIIARFFLTASLFGVFLSLLGIYSPLRGTFSLQAVVHTFTLGFMAMTMVGALFQMLPVVAGAVIENPLPKARFVHVAMLSGTVLLVVGFLRTESLFLLSGMLLLSGGILFIAPLMLYRLLKLRSYTPTSSGMRYAVGMFILGTLLGISMVLSLTGFMGLDYLLFARTHFNVMLFGWTGILIASVAFQVVEMFFVTPPYPKRYAHAFHPLTVGFFFLALLDGWLPKLPLSLLFISFALLTVLRLRERRRKIPDPLISLWYTGMLLLSLSMLVFPFAEFGSREFLLFLILYGSFVHSIILAMMYRIIPFLVWLHLSNMGVPNAPTMHEVIRPRRVWAQFYIHLITVFLIVCAFFVGVKALWLVCALSYLISFSLLFLNLLTGVWIYVRRAYQRGASPQRL